MKYQIRPIWTEGRKDSALHAALAQGTCTMSTALLAPNEPAPALIFPGRAERQDNREVHSWMAPNPPSSL